MAVLLECSSCYQSYAVPQQALGRRTVCPWCGEPSSLAPSNTPGEASGVGSNQRFGSGGGFPELSPSRFPKRRHATPAVVWMIVGIGLGAGVVLAVLTFSPPMSLRGDGASEPDGHAPATVVRSAGYDASTPIAAKPTNQSSNTQPASASRADVQAQSERQRELVRQVLREELDRAARPHVVRGSPVVVRGSPDPAHASDRRSPGAPTSATLEVRELGREKITDRWKSSRPPPIGDPTDDSPALGLMLPERDHSQPNRAIERTPSDPAARKPAPPVRASDDAKAITALVAAGIRCDKDSEDGRVTRVDGSFRMTDALMAHVAKLHGLTHLKLSFTDVSDTGLAHVKELTELQELILNQTKITHAGMAHLDKLVKLEKLDLEKTQVSDDGLSHLNTLKELKHLDLRGTKITPAAAAALKASLPSAKIRH